VEPWRSAPSRSGTKRARSSRWSSDEPRSLTVDWGLDSREIWAAFVRPPCGGEAHQAVGITEDGLSTTSDRLLRLPDGAAVTGRPRGYARTLAIGSRSSRRWPAHSLRSWALRPRT
jgi:hypothetical protein